MRADEAAEYLAGADFDEGVDAGANHVLDAPEPVDAVAELIDELFPYVPGGDHGLGTAVGYDGDEGIAEADLIYCGSHAVDGGLHEVGVEGRADGEGDDLLGAPGRERGRGRWRRWPWGR